MHEVIQSYMEHLYTPYTENIKQSLCFYGNEHYGELYYYSAVKLLRYLNILDTDHFLDLDSGLGRLIFQLFLTTNVQTITGIEINGGRYYVSKKISETMQQDLPLMRHRELNIIQGDFLKRHFSDVSVIYVFSSVFSFALLEAIGKKINDMAHVRKIATFIKLPNMVNFQLIKILDLHCSWDKVPCYIYERKSCQ